MAVFGEEPLATTSQDIVVDIEPTSEHGAPFDLVYVTMTAVVDGRVVRTSDRHEVRPDGDEFTLTLVVPVRGTALTKDVHDQFRWSVLALLPRTTPAYEVQVRTAGEPAGQQLSQDHESPRVVIAWYGTEDPPIDVVWKYVRAT